MTNRQSNMSITYYNCGKRGHYAKDCRSAPMQSAAATITQEHNQQHNSPRQRTNYGNTSYGNTNHGNQNQNNNRRRNNGRAEISSAASQVKKANNLPKEVHDPTSKHQVIDIEIEGNKALALIDPQTTGGNLMSNNYASTYNLPLIQMLEPIQVNLALKGSRGSSTHYVNTKIRIGTHEREASFLIVALDDWDVILGHPLLRDVKAIIDVAKAQMTITPSGGRKEILEATDVKRRPRTRTSHPNARATSSCAQSTPPLGRATSPPAITSLRTSLQTTKRRDDLTTTNEGFKGKDYKTPHGTNKIADEVFNHFFPASAINKQGQQPKPIYTKQHGQQPKRVYAKQESQQLKPIYMKQRQQTKNALQQPNPLQQPNTLQQPRNRNRKLKTTETSRITKKTFDLGFDPIAEFPDVFPTSKPTALPPLCHINHEIKIMDEEVHRRMKPRRFKPREAFMQQLQEKIAAELKTGRIYQVTDSSACNLFMIGKIDKPEEARFLHDLKDQNDNTYPDKTSIPDIPSIINCIARHPYRSKIDITNAYHEVRILPEHEKYAAFATPFGTFRTRVMQQGDCNAPATMMKLMHSIFQDMLGIKVFIYLDDILIFSKTLEDHIETIREICRRLRKHKLYANRSKSAFLPDRISVLGHVLTTNGIIAAPEKLLKVQN